MFALLLTLLWNYHIYLIITNMKYLSKSNDHMNILRQTLNMETYLHILSLLYISYDNVDKDTSMETFVTDLVVD